jgi:glycosyltransferase involved in cell wall biosynthesis
LKQRLDSIFNQTYKNFEVILLDDKSTDTSRSILTEYSKHKNVSHCIFNESNSGSTFKQWNKGVALAKGDYIWIAESDDFCEPDFLEKVIKPFYQNKEITLSYCQSHRVNSKGIVTGNWITHTDTFENNPFNKDFILDGDLFIQRYLIHKNVIPNASAVLIKKESLKAIMPLVFKPFMKYNADWFYYIQLVCNAKVAFTSESLNYFRYHDTSVIGKAEGETGFLKIYKMEIDTLTFMFRFLKSRNLKNIKIIKKHYKINNNNRRQKRASLFIDNQQYFKAVLSTIHNKLLLKGTLIKLYRRFRSGI